MNSYLAKFRRRMFFSPLIPVILKEIRACRQLLYRLDDLERRMKSAQEALGRIEARQTRACALADSEFKVFSQWGEDGIIQHLINQIPIPRSIFVEIGVECYEEANTRFLMVNNNWSGLVIEADRAHVERIMKSREYWLHNLKVACEFVTRDNINRILREHGVTGEIGLLSIDIDGMDYWIWEAITEVSPAIVVIEYNHRFGAERAVTVPYEENFDRREKHPSLVYYGASLKALEQLGDTKGYVLVGCGRAGLNAFFVRRDLLPSAMKAMTAEEAFKGGQFCEAHDQHGNRVKMNPEEERRLLEGLPLVNVGGGNGKHAS